MGRPRGTTNKNASGSAASRRARKQWLLDTFGDGVTCPCTHCDRTLTFETLTQDRKVPGVLGGTYKRANLQPSCGPCNSRLGSLLRWEIARNGMPEVALEAD